MMVTFNRDVAYIIPIPPVPASRPRVSKFGTYYGKTYTEWRKLAQEFFTHVEPMVPLLEGPLAVQLWIGVNPPKTKRLYPRGDGDNFEKAIFDAITTSKKVWYDDDQVVVCHWIKYFEAHFPGVGVKIHEIGDVYNTYGMSDVWLF